MRFKIDHDLHVHTNISPCTYDPEQTPENIIKVAKEKGIKVVNITDHFWDSDVIYNVAQQTWKEGQNFKSISRVRPLPEDDEVKLLFGCEADLDSDDVIGIAEDKYDEFDFIVIATTHFHMMKGEKWADRSPEALAKHWIERIDKVLDSNLPFYKVGIAHLACCLIDNRSREQYLTVLDTIPRSEMERVFKKAAERGVGIEINVHDVSFRNDSEIERILPIFRIAKACGCKFYLGTDAHEQEALLYDNETVFARAIELLGLEESDKMDIPGLK